jgi:hypothetical protein
MIRENKKTVLGTIRLSKGLDELLQKDADSKRITVGALIFTILTKYSQWDRYTLLQSQDFLHNALGGPRKKTGLPKYLVSSYTVYSLPSLSRIIHNS